MKCPEELEMLQIFVNVLAVNMLIFGFTWFGSEEWSWAQCPLLGCTTPTFMETLPALGAASLVLSLITILLTVNEIKRNREKEEQERARSAFGSS